MVVVCVYVHVKSEHRQAFIEASLENARQSLQEPGNLRFDVLQQDGDPDRFTLYEAYRDDEAIAAHKKTPHYGQWAERVAPWMAEPRKSVRHTPLFPAVLGQWSAR